MSQETKGVGLNSRFKVTFSTSGMSDIYFKSCMGIEMEAEVVTYPEGGRYSAPKTGRGSQRVNRISFSHGSSADGKKLFDWFLDVCDSSKPLKKAHLSVSVLDSSGQSDLIEWRILNAWPCKWVGPLLGASDSTGETVEFTSFAHEGIERVKK